MLNLHSISSVEIHELCSALVPSSRSNNEKSTLACNAPGETTLMNILRLTAELPALISDISNLLYEKVSVFVLV
jgi:hypothetical protein